MLARSFSVCRPENKSNQALYALSRVIGSTDTLRRDKSSGMLVAANGFQGGTSGKSPEVLSSAVVITLAPTSTTLGGYRRGSQFFRQIGSSCLEIARTVIACGGLMPIAAAEIATLMDPVKVDEAKFRTAFVLILVLLISGLFLAVTWPFLQALLVGAMLAGLCQPLYRWLVRLLGGRRSLASAATLLILLAILIGPVSAVLGLVVAQALTVASERYRGFKKTSARPRPSTFGNG